MGIEVSVFITTFNQKRYIKQCIESSLMQKTSFEYEILINDDCSSDGTKEIVLEYAKQYPDRIKAVTHETNMYSQGYMPNKDFLYPLARGKYFAFCEGDDYWCDDDKLQAQYDTMEENTTSPLCVHASNIINGVNDELLSINRPYDKDCIVERKRLLGEVHGFATASYFIRRTAYESYISSGMINQKAHGDFNMSIFFATLGPIIYLERPMSVYRSCAVGSISESYFQKKNKDRYKALETLYNNRCSSLDYLDEITSSTFHNEIMAGKQFCEYEYYYDTGRIRELKKKYKDKYVRESFKRRCKLFFKAFCPSVYYWAGDYKRHREANRGSGCKEN